MYVIQNGQIIRPPTNSFMPKKNSFMPKNSFTQNNIFNNLKQLFISIVILFVLYTFTCEINILTFFKNIFKNFTI